MKDFVNMTAHEFGKELCNDTEGRFAVIIDNEFSQVIVDLFERRYFYLECSGESTDQFFELRLAANLTYYNKDEINEQLATQIIPDYFIVDFCEHPKYFECRWFKKIS